MSSIRHKYDILFDFNRNERGGREMQFPHDSLIKPREDIEKANQRTVKEIFTGTDHCVLRLF
jgi:hypothetical protein